MVCPRNTARRTAQCHKRLDTRRASNFKAIYQVPALKAAFLLFLKNVYNLYQEDRFHSLIDQVANSGKSDKEIYQLIHSQLSTINPFLSELR